jgi:hypothetical protein
MAATNAKAAQTTNTFRLLVIVMMAMPSRYSHPTNLVWISPSATKFDCAARRRTRGSAAICSKLMKNQRLTLQKFIQLRKIFSFSEK